MNPEDLDRREPCPECDVHPTLTPRTIPGLPDQAIYEIVRWHLRTCSRYNGQDAPAAPADSGRIIWMPEHGIGGPTYKYTSGIAIGPVSYSI